MLREKDVKPLTTDLRDDPDRDSKFTRMPLSQEIQGDKIDLLTPEARRKVEVEELRKNLAVQRADLIRLCQVYAKNREEAMQEVEHWAHPQEEVTRFLATDQTGEVEAWDSGKRQY